MKAADTTRATLTCAAVLAVCAVVFVGWVAFRGETYLLRDVVGLHHPWREFCRSELAAGRLPLWNPYNHAGCPFTANPQTQTFYPFGLRLMAQRFGPALTGFFVLHALIATAGMCVFLRSVGCAASGCLVGAIVFWYGGWSMARMEFVTMYATAAWAPWGLWAVGRCVARGRGGDVALAGLVFAVQTLAGHPNNLFICGLCYSCWALVALAWQAREGFARVVRAALRLAGAGLLAGGLTCVLLLPLREFTALSFRGRGLPFEMAAQRSVFPAHLRTLVTPFAFGGPGYAAYRGGELEEFWCGSYYVGLLPLALAAASLVWWPRGVDRRRGASSILAGGVMVALGVALALGKHSPVYHAFYEHVPLFDRFRWPGKFMLMGVVGLAMLAGIGAQRVGLALGHRPRWRHALAAAVVLATAGDLWLFGHGLNATVANAFYDPPTRHGPAAHRVLCEKRSLTLNNYLYACTRPAAFEWGRELLLAYTNLVARVDMAHADDPLRLRTIAQILDLAQMPEVPAPARERLLQMLSVGEVRSDRDVQPRGLDLIERPSDHVRRRAVAEPLPRAWLVHRAVAKPQVQVGMLCAKDFDPRRLALVSTDAGDVADLSGRGRARVTAREAHVVRVAVDLVGRGLLVLSDAMFPGWAAYVDGRWSPIVRANYALRSVVLREGDRDVRFVYRPRSFKLGAGVSLAFVAGLVAWVLAWVRRGPTR